MTLSEYITKYKVDKHSFAAKIGLSHVNALYKYTTGNRIPDYERMVKIEQVTGGKVKPNDFYK